MSEWKLVPVEPTDEMCGAVLGEFNRQGRLHEGMGRKREPLTDAAIYQAMVAAAPPAPSAEPVQCAKCNAFFARYRCNKPQECDCPKCQGYCDCPPDHTALMRQALGALEIGYDAAKAAADQFHAAMAGYKPARHAAMDKEVQTIAAAIDALRAALEPKPC
jgi:hypothetical protein